MPRFAVFLSLLSLVAFGACAPDDPRPAIQLPVQESVVGTAMDLELNSFVALIDSARMRPDLTMPGPFTIFAPDDAAFARLDPPLLGALTAHTNRGALQDLVRYHIVEDSLPPPVFVAEQSFATLQGESITVTSVEGELTLTDAQGITARIRAGPGGAGNGLVYVIDRVLLHVPVEDLVNISDHDPLAGGRTGEGSR